MVFLTMYKVLLNETAYVRCSFAALADNDVFQYVNPDGYVYPDHYRKLTNDSAVNLGTLAVSDHTQVLKVGYCMAWGPVFSEAYPWADVVDGSMGCDPIEVLDYSKRAQLVLTQWHRDEVYGDAEAYQHAVRLIAQLKRYGLAIVPEGAVLAIVDELDAMSPDHSPTVKDLWKVIRRIEAIFRNRDNLRSAGS